MSASTGFSPGRRRRVSCTAILAAMLSASLACSLPIRPPGQEEAETTATPTITAVVPSPASPSPLPATDTPTDTPTATPTVTPTATLEPPVFTTNVNANCRSGPGTVYDVVRGLPAGTTEDIIGKDASGTWWVVQDGVRCWVSATTGTAAGDLSAVPVIPAPPTPTRTATAAPSATPTVGIIFIPSTIIILPPLNLVSGATVTADQTSYLGPCPYTATWHGTITATGPLTASYVWEEVYHDGTWRQVGSSGSLTFSGAGTMNTADYWIQAPFSQAVRMRLHVTAPNSLYSTVVMVTINCRP